MRVVGGIWRGRELRSPAGRDTRPTTDRNRERLASMVQAAFGLDLSGVAVLDAFAGSGALGLELLSRGAARATFVDAARPAVACVRANVAALGAQACASVVAGDVLRLAAAGPALPGAPFSCLLLDPPYALEVQAVAGLVASLWKSGQLSEGCLVAYERGSGGTALDLSGTCVPVASARPAKKHKTTAFDLLRVGSGAEGEE